MESEASGAGAEAGRLVGGPRDVLGEMLAARLGTGPRAWWEETRLRVALGVPDAEFARLLSLASRHAPRRALQPGPEELERAARALPGWNPERWSALEALRVALVLARADLEQPSCQRALEDCFCYADEGELVALYRSLAFLPAGQRYAWRAGEGCRTNIRPVFEAVACDNPYPALHFDDPTWNQMVVKALFVGAPAWRIQRLDARLSAELARMALDLADERRSAGRGVPCELWLCLGPHGGARGLAAIEAELVAGGADARRAAALALARAGEEERLVAWLERERDPAVTDTMRAALRGQASQYDFAAIVRSG